MFFKLNLLFKTILHYLEFSFIYPLFARLPIKLAYKVASFKGMVEGVLCKETMNLSMLGLAHGFSSDSQVCKKIAKAQLRMLAREKMDVFLLDRITPETLHQYIKIKGLSNYSKAIKTNRPVILYTAHFGRSIMPPIALGILGFETHALTVSAQGTQQEKIYLDKKINAIQKIIKGKFIHTDQSVRTLYTLLKQKKTLVIAIDVPPAINQDYYQTNFLNGIIRCPKGTVKLAKKMDAILIPYFATENEGYLSGEFMPPILTTGLDEQTIFQLLLQPIEEKVLNYPEQWWAWSWLNSFWEQENSKINNIK